MDKCNFGFEGDLIALLPFVCLKILDSTLSSDELKVYIASLGKQIRAKMLFFYGETSRINCIYLTNEERNAVSRMQGLKERELIGYYKALKFLYRYGKTSKKMNILNAMQIYEEAQKSFKKLLIELTGFIALNLSARGILGKLV